MSTYIFAVGGSGVRVLRALTMLLASGCKGTSVGNEIVANVIDYDTTNGDKERTVELMKTYHALHKGAYRSTDTDQEQFFCNPLMMLRDKCDAAQRESLNGQATFDLHLSPDATNQTFAQYIGYGSLGLGNNNLETKELLDSLYDTSDEKNPGTSDDNPKAELHMNLHKGFRGCPSLGCIVTKHLEQSSELQLAVSALIQPNDRIVIIGSLFGGTGASGIPMLLDYFDGHPNTQAARKAVIALMPYFNVAPPDGSNKSAIDSNTFIAKVKAAISAYSNGGIYNQANCFYYVGDEPKNTFANVDGQAGQKNDAHYVELAGAMCVLDFITQANNGGFEVGLADWNDNGLTKDSFYRAESYDRFIHPMARFKLFSTFCKNYLLNGKSNPKDIWLNGIAARGCKAIGDPNCRGYRDLISKFIIEFDTWIKELANANSHRPLTLFNDTNDYKNVWKFCELHKAGGFWGIGSWEIKDEHFTKPLTDQYNQDTPAAQGAIVDRPEYLFWRGSKHTMDEIDNELRKQKLI